MKQAQQQQQQPPTSTGSAETYELHRPPAASAVPSQEEWRRVYSGHFQPPWSPATTKTTPPPPPLAATATATATPAAATPSSSAIPLQQQQQQQQQQQRPHRAQNKPIMYMGSRQKQPSQSSVSSSPPPSLGPQQGQQQLSVLTPLRQSPSGKVTSISPDTIQRGSESSSDSTDTGDESETLSRLKEEIRLLKADLAFLQKGLCDPREESKRPGKLKPGAAAEENERLRAELERMREKYERSNEYAMLLEKKVFHLTSIKFSLEKAVTKMATQLREQQEAYRAISAELERKNEQAIQELKDAHEKALAQVRQEYESAFARLKESFSASSDELRATSDATVKKVKANQDAAIVAICECVTGVEVHDASIKEYYMSYKEELEPLAEVDTLLARAEKRISRTEEGEEEDPWRAQYRRMCEEGKDPFQVPEAATTPAEPPGMNVAQLVDMAVDSYASDGSFVPHLLMMYRTFTNASVLFKTIAAKYVKLCADDEGNCGSTADESDSNKNSAMRAVLDDLLFRWTKLYPNDFVGNDLKSLLMIFVKNFVVSHVYRDSIISFVSTHASVPVSSFLVPPQPPSSAALLPPSSSSVPSSSASSAYPAGAGEEGQAYDPARPLSAFDPEDLAHQIILDDSEIFSRVTLEDVLNPGKAKTVPNVKAISDRFNWISSWVQTEIVTVSPKERSPCLKRIVRLAKVCLDNNDFLATLAVGSVFDTAAIVRLKFVNEIIEKRFNEKDRAAFAEVRNLAKMGNNYRNLRQAMSKVVPPVVPFFGIYLRDFVFINDGNPETINGGINFTKKRMLAEKYQEIIGFQSAKYSFVRNVALANWMAAQKVLLPQECFIKSKEAEQHDTK